MTDISKLDIAKEWIEKLANGADKNINDRLFVGERIGVYYDYIYDGIWKSSEAEERMAA